MILCTLRRRNRKAFQSRHISKRSWEETAGPQDWSRVAELSAPGQDGPDRRLATRFGGNSHMRLDFFCCRPETEGSRSAIPYRESAIPFFCWIVRSGSNYQTPLCDSMLLHRARTGYHCSLRGRDQNIHHHQSLLPPFAYPNAQWHPSIPDSQARLPGSCGDSLPTVAATIHSVTNHTTAR